MEFRRVLFRSEADSGVLRHEGVALLPEWLERLAKPGLVDADAVVFHRCQRVAAFGARAAGHAAAALGVLDGVGDAVDERLAGEARSEERRVGKDCVSTCRARWSPSISKK